MLILGPNESIEARPISNSSRSGKSAIFGIEDCQRRLRVGIGLQSEG